MTQRSPKHQNEEAERALLGAMLVSDQAYWQVAAQLRSDHFATPIHREIFTAIKDVLESGKRLSQTILKGRLPEEYDGGKTTAAYLAVLATEADGIAATDFVDQVVEAWNRRRLTEIADTIRKELRSADKPAIDIVADIETSLVDVGSGAGDNPTVTLKDIAGKVLATSAKSYQDKGYKVGLDTGLATLDAMIGQLRGGRLYFLGGGEKSGKTALAAQIIRRAATRGFISFMAQGEMNDEEIGVRELAGATGIATQTIESGDYTYDEYERIQDASRAEWMERFLFWEFGQSNRVRISQLRHRCLAERRRHNIGLIVVDHLLHVEPDKHYENEFRGIATVVYGLKSLARELDVPVICMTHRTRGSQDRGDPTPYATDFYGGGVIERTCDALFCIYSKHRWLQLRRPENKGPEQLSKWETQLAETKGKVQIALLSHRHAPFPRIEEFAWNGQFTRVEEL